MKKTPFASFLTLGLLITQISSCLIHDEIYDPTRQPDTTYYIFNPNTILQEIKNGTPSFIEVNESFEPSSENTVIVEWRQADYLEVAKAVHYYFWQSKLDLEVWQLDVMLFRTDCEYVNKGFQSGGFEFSRKINYFSSEVSGIKDRISINASEGYIVRWHSYRRTHLDYSNPIDLSELSISVDEALVTAEDRGGDSIREVRNNDCSISALLAPNGIVDNWSVSYQDNDLNIISEAIINPYSGQFIP